MRLMACMILLLSQTVWAQSNDLEEAFKREFSYLAIQKEVVSRQLGLSAQKHVTLKKNLENQILLLEKKSAEQAFLIDSLTEKVGRMEKRKRENLQKVDSLNSLYKKARNYLDDLEHELSFEKKTSPAKWTASEIKVADFSAVADQSLLLLESASTIKEEESHYFNQEGNLVNTTLLRFGRLGAQLLEDGKSRLLGPSPQGALIDLGIVADRGLLQSLFIFENLSDRIELKKTANIWDKFADKLPLIVLVFIFSIVLGLFTLFAKE